LKFNKTTLELTFTPTDSSQGSSAVLEFNIGLSFKTGNTRMNNYLSPDIVSSELNFGQLKRSTDPNNTTEFYVFGIINGLNNNQPRFYFPVFINDDPGRIPVEIKIEKNNYDISNGSIFLENKYPSYNFYITDSVSSSIFPPLNQNYTDLRIFWYRRCFV